MHLQAIDSRSWSSSHQDGPVPSGQRSGKHRIGCSLPTHPTEKNEPSDLWRPVMHILHPWKMRNPLQQVGKGHHPLPEVQYTTQWKRSSVDLSGDVYLLKDDEVLSKTRKIDSLDTESVGHFEDESLEIFDQYLNNLDKYKFLVLKGNHKPVMQLYTRTFRTRYHPDGLSPFLEEHWPRTNASSAVLEYCWKNWRTRRTRRTFSKYRKAYVSHILNTSSMSTMRT